MKALSIQTVAVVLLFVLCAGGVSAQNNINPMSDQAVQPGKNGVVWNNGADFNQQVTLTARFTPAVHKFVDKSGYAAPIYGVNWTSVANGTQEVKFQMTATFNPPAKKAYPTYFRGKFDIQRAPGGNGGGHVAPPSWEASGAFMATNEQSHKHYRIAYTLSDYKIESKNTVVLNDVVVNHNNMTWTHDVFTIAISAKNAHPIALSYFGFTKPTVSYSQELYLNTDCEIPCDPKCVKMCKGVAEVKGEYKDTPKIHLPVWTQLNMAGPKTQMAWAAMRKNILAHEQQHEKIYNQHFCNNEWWTKWAMNKHEVTVCVNDAKEAQIMVQEYCDEYSDRATKEYEKMDKEYDTLQDKIDINEKANGYPSYLPMAGSPLMLCD